MPHARLARVPSRSGSGPPKWAASRFLGESWTRVGHDPDGRPQPKRDPCISSVLGTQPDHSGPSSTQADEGWGPPSVPAVPAWEPGEIMLATPSRPTIRTQDLERLAVLHSHTLGRGGPGGCQVL